MKSLFLKIRKEAPVIFVLLSAILVFHLCIGISTVLPTNIAWLARGDLAQHYLGWSFFRMADWAWPLTSFDTFIYPVGTSVAFTDSIPLVSLALKAVSFLLPSPFQFQGLWLLLCYVLQGFIAYQILKLYLRDKWVIGLASLMLVFSPAFIHREFHITLYAHWIILAAIFCFGLQTKERLNRKAYMFCLVLNILAAGIHPYLNAMTLLIAFTQIFANSISVSSNAIRSALLVGCNGLAWYVFGYFDGSNIGGFGFGIYSANVLTFFDPMIYSRFIPDIPTPGEQYEGFAYLGIGVIFLMLLSVGFVLKKPLLYLRTQWTLLLGLFVSLFLFSLASPIYFANAKIVNLNWLYDHLDIFTGVFRSSGRLVWPLYYFISLASLVIVARACKIWTARALLATCLAIQIIDIWPLVEDVRGKFRNYQPYQNFLEERWTNLSSEFDHVALIPPQVQLGNCSTNNHYKWNDWVPFAFLAARENLTLNSGYVARSKPDVIQEHCTDWRSSLADLDRTLLFVRDGIEETKSIFESPNLTCKKLDNFSGRFRYCYLATVVRNL